MRIIIIISIALCICAKLFSGDEMLLTDISSKCYRVYQDHYLNGHKRNPDRYFRAVRGGGVDFELDGIHLERFMDLVKVVSNNCSQIASDWYSYETNEMVRFTTLSAVGYSGYNNYTNFVDKLLAFTETDTRTNYWRSLRFIMLPYGTKQETKLALTYEDVVVSNIFVRIRQQAINNVDTNSVNFCNRVLSGEWKREHLQMEAAGAL